MEAEGFVAPPSSMFPAMHLSTLHLSVRWSVFAAVMDRSRARLLFVAWQSDAWLSVAATGAAPRGWRGDRWRTEADDGLYVVLRSPQRGKGAPGIEHRGAPAVQITSC